MVGDRPTRLGSEYPRIDGRATALIQALACCLRLAGDQGHQLPWPSSNLWLARSFNARDVDAAAAMYHPEASIVQVDQVHGGSKIARGAAAIRETIAAYIGLKPHTDVITHHTTVAGDFAMTRSQWLIRLLRSGFRRAGCVRQKRPDLLHRGGFAKRFAIARIFSTVLPSLPRVAAFRTHLRTVC